MNPFPLIQNICSIYFINNFFIADNLFKTKQLWIPHFFFFLLIVQQSLIKRICHSGTQTIHFFSLSKQIQQKKNNLKQKTSYFLTFRINQLVRLFLQLILCSELIIKISSGSKMIPLGKLLTLFVKTFSKPMLSYARKMHEKKRWRSLNGFLIWFGRKYYQGENFINYTIRKMNKPKHMRQISEDTALEKGIETLHELFLYSVVLGIPLYEMHKASEDSKKKQEKLQNRLMALETRSQQLKQLTTRLSLKKYSILLE